MTHYYECDNSRAAWKTLTIASRLQRLHRDIEEASRLPELRKRYLVTEFSTTVTREQIGTLPRSILHLSTITDYIHSERPGFFNRILEDAYMKGKAPRRKNPKNTLTIFLLQQIALLYTSTHQDIIRYIPNFAARTAVDEYLSL